MATPNNTFTYIQVTDKNLSEKDAVFDATVVANYGDPGLDEDYHADILSRYVICKLESSNRTLTSDRYKNMLIVVQRPSALWINYQGGFLNDPVNQQRVDAQLNANVGAAGSYSANAIPRMNLPYNLGDKIKVKLIKSESPSYLLNQDNFFVSQCNVWDNSVPNSTFYQSWHTQGLNSNNYIVNSNGAANLRMKTLSPTDNTNTYYSIVINKIQYEAFSLTLFSSAAASLVSLFSNQSRFSYYYDANGGYAFSQNFTLDLNFVKYEDINVDGRARTSITNCIPLIVTSPETFTIPQTRQSGTINYVPTYIQKS